MGCEEWRGPEKYPQWIPTVHDGQIKTVSYLRPFLWEVNVETKLCADISLGVSGKDNYRTVIFGYGWKPNNDCTLIFKYQLPLTWIAFVILFPKIVPEKLACIWKANILHHVSSRTLLGTEQLIDNCRQIDVFT